MRRPDSAFWRGRRVLLTGHTGFKGTWASTWLSSLGAEVTGLSLAPPSEPNMFELVGAEQDVRHVIGDLRDFETVRSTIESADPEIVIHLAAQPIVRRAAKMRLPTIQTNTLGTVNLLEALTAARSFRVAVLATTDKVYRNDGQGSSFVESDHLGGSDIYAGSKAAAEVLAEAYSNAVFAARGVRIATARGGNVIGGGDFGEDRLVPDIVRAVQGGVRPIIRYPDATRPWQHVLDCLAGYFRYAESLWAEPDLPAALNFGPTGPELPVSTVARAMLSAFGVAEDLARDASSGPKEAQRLAVDSSAARERLGWRPQLDSETAIGLTADWYRTFWHGGDVRALTREQLSKYHELSIGHPAEVAQ